ncbi:hypothetical protein FE257_007658 [Aspergillus nanangensis]|uniref:YtxH domain-containing protein n=1 Tax=Aspergillus nanangensis TaxID=2582783 RepID=A0AAD4GT49_ASPNN|nr:hypothetical protein FE257_007658 [Aspergillus nanangensis]
MSKNRTGLYAALAAAGAGGYYLYRAGGDPKGAKEEMKHDVDKARNKASSPGQAEQKAEKFGAEAGEKIDEAVANAKTKATEADKKAAGVAQESLDKLNEARQDVSQKLRTEIEKADQTVEQKASEAKGTVSV